MLTETSVVSRPTAAGKDHILLLSTACGESADEQGREFAHDDNGCNAKSSASLPEGVELTLASAKDSSCWDCP